MDIETARKLAVARLFDKHLKELLDLGNDAPDFVERYLIIEQEEEIENLANKICDAYEGEMMTIEVDDKPIGGINE